MNDGATRSPADPKPTAVDLTETAFAPASFVTYTAPPFVDVALLAPGVMDTLPAADVELEEEPPVNTRLPATPGWLPCVEPPTIDTEPGAESVLEAPVEEPAAITTFPLTAAPTASPAAMEMLPPDPAEVAPALITMRPPSFPAAPPVEAPEMMEMAPPSSCAPPVCISTAALELALVLVESLTNPSASDKVSAAVLEVNAAVGAERSMLVEACKTTFANAPPPCTPDGVT